MTTMTAEGRKVWLSPGRATYLGPQLRWDRHSTPVDYLAIDVDDAFTVHSPEGSRRRRSALVPARVQHRIDAGQGRVLLHYLDPGPARAAEVRSRMSETLEPIGATHLAEQAMLAQVHDPDELNRLAPPSAGCSTSPRQPSWPQIITTHAVRADPASGFRCHLVGLRRSLTRVGRSSAVVSAGSKVGL